jgi:hypothetical protein
MAQKECRFVCLVISGMGATGVDWAWNCDGDWTFC